jgi:hypothetical protein
MADVERKCQQCERLKLAAIEASKTYHDLLSELESAHISHKDALIPGLRERRDKALLSRDTAISELAAHENTHKRAKSTRA